MESKKTDKERMSQIPATPPFIEKYLRAKRDIYKKASESSTKIKEIEDAFKDGIEKEICYMLATSHEYKKPNISNSISFVRNYDWVLMTTRLVLIEGINKPVDDDRVRTLSRKMKTQTPLIVVNQLNGILPQTRGKSILFDGHHRYESYKDKGFITTPIYKGFYTGGDSITKRNLMPKFSKKRRNSFSFDYDDTIIVDGEINEDVVKVMRYLKAKGQLVILETCRSGQMLDEAIDVLRRNKIPFDEVNVNSDFETNSRKIFADIKVDNRAINVKDVLDLMVADIPDWSEE